jgi:hypothetical protein
MNFIIPEGYKGRLENTCDGLNWAADTFTIGPAVINLLLEQSTSIGYRFVLYLILKEKK